MQHRLVASYALLVLLALALFTVPVTVNLSRLLHDNQAEVALREARTVGFLLGAVVDTENVDTADEQVTGRALAELRRLFEEQTGGRVELIDATGKPALGRPVARPDSPEVLAALRGEESVVPAERAVSDQAGVEVTVPARDQTGRIDGAVRLTFPRQPVDDQVRSALNFRLAAGLLVLGVAGLVALLLARSLTRPLRELTAMAAKLSSGDFDARVQERDPREIRQLGRTLNEGARQLGALVTAQQRFIADVSHQLRTPLTALRLNLDTLQEVQREPATRKVLDRTITEVVRMTQLVNDLLALASSQAQPVHLEPANLAEIVHQRVQAWEAAAVEHDVTLDARPHPDHTVLFTPGQIEQVLDNVLSNALAVAPAGSTVQIRSRADGGRVHLEIADQGPGMSEQQIEHAFDRFWRGRTGGTGLGLTIVREFVELNDGSVQLRNGQPCGLVVDLALKANGR